MTFIDSVIAALPLLLDGLAMTMLICSAGMVVAFLMAIPIVAAQRSDRAALSWLARVWVKLIRGLPIVILVFLMYFGLPALLGLGRVSAIWVGIFALGINGAVFISEVLRAAINQVPKGQWEASQSLALGRVDMWRFIVLPQAFRIALPALVGELTFLVKASPVLSLITVVDLTRRAQQVSMQTFDPLAPMVAAAFLYFIVLYTLSVLSRGLERRLGVGASA